MNEPKPSPTTDNENENNSNKEGKPSAKEINDSHQKKEGANKKNTNAEARDSDKPYEELGNGG